jgi:hypothetical protein
MGLRRCHVACMVRILAVVSTASILASVAVASPVMSETATSGAVRATVSYAFLRSDVYYVRLAVARAGQQVYGRRVLPLSRSQPWNQPLGDWRKYGIANARTITLRDLNGDGEPEILLEFWFGGAHCCYWTRIYRWDPATSTYATAAHFWGNFDFQLRDLTGLGRIELVSADNRFAYEFASFAGSGAPVQIWDYRSGRLVDATRTYPAQVSADATRWWKFYREARHSSGEVRGLLAAWAADESLLGRGRPALAWLAQHRFVLSNQYDEQGGSVTAYLKHLRIFLRRTGYFR